MSIFKVKIGALVIIIFSQIALGAVLVHNSLKDMEACKGKLQLKLIRVWGGDDEQDENKFFSLPGYIAVSDKNTIYISDSIKHYIKVFDFAGNYIRTIGRRGVGPGDVLNPEMVCIYPNGDILVNERMGRRLQRFSSEGKSKNIIKSKYFNNWIALTAKDEIAVHSHYNTFFSRKLITIMDQKGNKLREFGKYTDNAKSALESELVLFSKDKNDNIYALNYCIPVIRKYSPDGKLIMVITFETPLKVKGKVNLTPDGNEIEVTDTDDQTSIEISSSSNGVSFQQKRDKICSGVTAIGVDSNERIYIITQRRELTEKEKRATLVTLSLDTIKRDLVDYDTINKCDAFKLVVLEKNGKVFTEIAIPNFAPGMYIFQNKLFLIDGYLNQRILEYEIIYKK